MKKISVAFLLFIAFGCVKVGGLKPPEENIEITYDRAMVFYTEQEYKKAGDLFLYIVNNTEKGDFKAKSLFYLGEIYKSLEKFGASLKAYAMANYYGIDCSENIKETAPNADVESLEKSVYYAPTEIKPYLLYIAARKYLTYGKGKESSALFSRIIGEYPNTIYARKAKYMEEAKGKIKVGVLLPLSGPYSEIGESVKRGIEIGSKDKFLPIYSDTKGSPLLSYKETREFIKREKVSGIIGPVLSLNSFAVACLTDYLRIPQVSPTATPEVIDSVGDMTYIINRSLSMQARAMADYAIRKLGLNSFSILYPAVEYGEALQKYFEKDVERLGGTIITSVAYREGDPDFKDELRLLKEGAPEALYIPALTTDITLLAPQLKYFKIKAQILGADGWKSEELFQQTDASYLNGVVLTGHPYNPTEDLRERFYFVYQGKPDRYTCLGYDAANLMGCLLNNSKGDFLKSNITFTAGALEGEKSYSQVPFYIINNGEFKIIE